MAGRDLDRGRLLIPDPVTITLTRPASTAGGPEEVITVERCQEQHASDNDVDLTTGGVLYGQQRTYHLWAAECSGLVPGEGWLIGAPDGTTWRVLSNEVLAHGRRYRLKTVEKQGA